MAVAQDIAELDQGALALLGEALPRDLLDHRSGLDRVAERLGDQLDPGPDQAAVRPAVALLQSLLHDLALGEAAMQDVAGEGVLLRRPPRHRAPDDRLRGRAP